MDIQEAAALREAQIHAVSKLLRLVHFRHIAQQEASILEYRAALLDTIESRLLHLSAGHRPSASFVIERLRRVAEPFIEAAVNRGYARGLRDLQSRGWIRHIVQPVVAPKGIGTHILTENDGYLHGLGQDLAAGGMSVAQIQARVGQYSHFIWHAAEYAYIQAMRDFDEASTEWTV
jgi:hypothetical protein